MKMKIVLGGCILALLAAASVAAYGQMKTAEIADAQNAGRVVDAEGNLRVPADYRTAYQFLGAWAVADEKGKGSKEMHVVYASPGAVSAYLKDGRFADGSVLVKEVFETTAGEMTTGTVSHPREGLVCNGEGQQEQPPGQQIMGGRLGVVLVR